MLAGAAVVALMMTLALLAWYGPTAQVGGSSSRPTALYDIVGSNGSVYNFGVPGSYGSLAGNGSTSRSSLLRSLPVARVTGLPGPVAPSIPSVTPVLRIHGVQALSGPSSV